MNIELEKMVTFTGLAREIHVAPLTLRRRIESGQIVPDAVLVETIGRPGSLLFKSARIPGIAAIIAASPN